MPLRCTGGSCAGALRALLAAVVVTRLFDEGAFALERGLVAGRNALGVNVPPTRRTSPSRTRKGIATRGPNVGARSGRAPITPSATQQAHPSARPGLLPLTSTTDVPPVAHHAALPGPGPPLE